MESRSEPWAAIKTQGGTKFKRGVHSLARESLNAAELDLDFLDGDLGAGCGLERAAARNRTAGSPVVPAVVSSEDYMANRDPAVQAVLDWKD